jgi:hypothetical protein
MSCPNRTAALIAASCLDLPEGVTVMSGQLGTKQRPPMKRPAWTEAPGALFACVGFVLTIVGFIVTITVPEIRCKAGLAPDCEASSPSSHASPNAVGSSYAPSPGSSAAPSTGTAGNLRLEDPSTGAPRKPQLVTVTVSGHMPPDHHAWIVVRSPATGRYYPQGRLEPGETDTRWDLPNVHIGSSDPADAGHTFPVFLLVTDDPSDIKLQGMSGAESDGGYSPTAWRDWLSRLSVDQASIVRCPSVRDASRCDG